MPKLIDTVNIDQFIELVYCMIESVYTYFVDSWLY